MILMDEPSDGPVAASGQGKCFAIIKEINRGPSASPSCWWSRNARAALFGWQAMVTSWNRAKVVLDGLGRRIARTMRDVQGILSLAAARRTSAGSFKKPEELQAEKALAVIVMTEHYVTDGLRNTRSRPSREAELFSPDLPGPCWRAGRMGRTLAYAERLKGHRPRVGNRPGPLLARLPVLRKSELPGPAQGSPRPSAGFRLLARWDRSGGLFTSPGPIFRG